MLPALLAASLVVASLPAALPVEPPPEPPSQGQLRWRGTGALIVGSLAGAVGLGLGIGTARQFAYLERCIDCGERESLLPIATIGLNTAAFSLIAAGAALRGQDEGRRFRRSGAPRRDAGTLIGLGATILAGGGVLVAGALAWRLSEAPRSTGTPWAIMQGGLSMIVAGTGVLVYGAYYRQTADAGLSRLRLGPQLGWRHAGVSLSGSF